MEKNFFKWVQNQNANEKLGKQKLEDKLSNLMSKIMRVGQNRETIRFPEDSSLGGRECKTKAKKA